MMSNLEYKDTIGFIKKVYSILSFQMICTTALVGMTILNPKIIQFQVNNMFIFWILMGLTMAAECTLLCCRHVGRQVPLNFILLGVVTLG